MTGNNFVGFRGRLDKYWVYCLQILERFRECMPNLVENWKI